MKSNWQFKTLFYRGYSRHYFIGGCPKKPFIIFFSNFSTEIWAEFFFLPSKPRWTEKTCVNSQLSFDTNFISLLSLNSRDKWHLLNSAIDICTNQLRYLLKRRSTYLKKKEKNKIMFYTVKYVVIADHRNFYFTQDDFQSGKFVFDPRWTHICIICQMLWLGKM